MESSKVAYFYHDLEISLMQLEMFAWMTKSNNILLQ